MGGTKETVKSGSTTENQTGNTTGGAAGGTTAVAGTGKTDRTAKANDSVYTVKELAVNAKALFGTMPECVDAALRMAGVETCTIEKARILVKNFLNQEV